MLLNLRWQQKEFSQSRSLSGEVDEISTVLSLFALQLIHVQPLFHLHLLLLVLSLSLRLSQMMPIKLR